MRIIATAFVALLAVSTLTACNTVEGMGKDTSAAGRAVSDTSRDVRR